MGKFLFSQSPPPETKAAERPPEPEQAATAAAEEPKPAPAPEPRTTESGGRFDLLEAKLRVHSRLIDEIDRSLLEKLTEEELKSQVTRLVRDIVREERIAMEEEQKKAVENGEIPQAAVAVEPSPATTATASPRKPHTQTYVDSLFQELRDKTLKLRSRFILHLYRKHNIRWNTFAT